MSRDKGQSPAVVHFKVLYFCTFWAHGNILQYLEWPLGVRARVLSWQLGDVNVGLTGRLQLPVWVVYCLILKTVYDVLLLRYFAVRLAVPPKYEGIHERWAHSIWHHAQFINQLNEGPNIIDFLFLHWPVWFCSCCCFSATRLRCRALRSDCRVCTLCSQSGFCCDTIVGMAWFKIDMAVVQRNSAIFLLSRPCPISLAAIVKLNTVWPQWTSFLSVAGSQLACGP